MYIILIAVFILGYVCIALEHNLKIDKAAAAILTGVVCWVLLIIGNETLLPAQEAAGGEGGILSFLDESLLEHVGEISEILFFLLAAMTIVELMDAHRGFEVVTDKITTTSRVKLLWIICSITFFFSAALDNLTTAIVMAALLRKLLKEREDQWFFGGMVILAANAGGAWSPIGDVTTIMLWIGGQITALNIITVVVLPSLFCLLVPLIVLTFKMKGSIDRPEEPLSLNEQHVDVNTFEQRVVFWLGVSGLLFVPVFKGLTHLPPFMGMLFSLGVLWVVTELMHKNKEQHKKRALSVTGVIRKVDSPSILFFLGILLAVASLQTAGILSDLAQVLDDTFQNIYLVNIFIGLLSSIVDNVPLVAGAMGMYSLETYPQDSTFWELLAYCAGTGGSVLIIGSAAGVAIMGLLKIEFMWYVKNISWIALIGYFAGVGVLYLIG
ncbi:sodium:proton antiporter NhaD [Flavimarina sp. Hel_I_48]|uniref:sodium:proton antiporter NhaD n=1 Tax=Flavimarina sp. Hel_I_48 TaxID=1392488 RepID=UPI0004DF4DFC|nr:sodium:proton antiporter NhaD [Flavimarina sp. Hel_I_48]